MATMYETGTDVVELDDDQVQVMRDWVDDTLSDLDGFPGMDALDATAVVNTVQDCYPGGVAAFLRNQ